MHYKQSNWPGSKSVTSFSEQSNLDIKKPSVVTFNFKGESLFGYFFNIFVLVNDYFSMHYNNKLYLPDPVLYFCSFVGQSDGPSLHKGSHRNSLWRS